MGNTLAKLTLTTLFQEIVRRLPDMEIDEDAGPITRLPSAWTNSLTSLPVRFTPGAVEAGS